MDSFFNLHFDSLEGDASTILPLFGGASKPVEIMTVYELSAAAEQVYNKVREQAFSRGLPVVVKVNGQIVREFSDGHFEPLL